MYERNAGERERAGRPKGKQALKKKRGGGYNNQCLSYLQFKLDGYVGLSDGHDQVGGGLSLCDELIGKGNRRHNGDLLDFLNLLGGSHLPPLLASLCLIVGWLVG